MAITDYQGPDIQDLIKLFTYAQGNPDINQYMAPIHSALTNLSSGQKRQALGEEAALGMQRSDITGNRFSDIDRSQLSSEQGIISQMMANREQRLYDEQQAQIERKRIQDAMDAQKQASQNMGLAQILGTIGGGALGLMGGPVGVGLGANLGGQFGRSLAGLNYGEQPDLSGIGDIGVNLADKDKWNTVLDYLSGKKTLGDETINPGLGTFDPNAPLGSMFKGSNLTSESEGGYPKNGWR